MWGRCRSRPPVTWRRSSMPQRSESVFRAAPCADGIVTELARALHLATGGRRTRHVTIPHRDAQSWQLARERPRTSLGRFRAIVDSRHIGPKEHQLFCLRTLRHHRRRQPQDQGFPAGRCKLEQRYRPDFTSGLGTSEARHESARGRKPALNSSFARADDGNRTRVFCLGIG
jgi:hypothetical protein